MTITYTAEVATSSFGCFLRLLIRWQGSIYRMVWKEFLIFAAMFFGLSAIYRFALTEFQRSIFESVVKYCEQYNNLIPIAFVLGFYVSIVVERWWGQYVTIPWPDRLAVFVTAHLQGQDERARLMRRTIMRYMCLSYVITLSSISPVIKKRFPTFRHMTEAGFMTEGEQKILESIDMPYNKYWIPLVWSTSLVTRARKENRIKDDMAVKTIIDEVNAVRGQMGHLFNYDWITVPLVYTQVVTLAVYMYLASCLMGHQFIRRNGEEDIGRDVYFPVFTFLQFFFYMGWLKVAEAMVNPFGEDDDDFNVNYMIDRNLQIAYMIVDDMHQEHPELIRDQYWDNMTFDLPYTQAAEPFRVEPKPLLGSAMNLSLDSNEAEFTRLESVQEDDSAMSGNSQNATTLEPSEFADTVERQRSESVSRKESPAMRFLRGFSRCDSTSSTSPLTSSKSAPATAGNPNPRRNSPARNDKTRRASPSDRNRRTSPSPTRNERRNSRSSRYDAVSANIPEENEVECEDEKKGLTDLGSDIALLPKSKSDSDNQRGV